MDAAWLPPANTADSPASPFMTAGPSAGAAMAAEAAAHPLTPQLGEERLPQGASRLSRGSDSNSARINGGAPGGDALSRGGSSRAPVSASIYSSVSLQLQQLAAHQRSLSGPFRALRALAEKQRQLAVAALRDIQDHSRAAEAAALAAGGKQLQKQGSVGLREPLSPKSSASYVSEQLAAHHSALGQLEQQLASTRAELAAAHKLSAEAESGWREARLEVASLRETLAQREESLLAKEEELTRMGLVSPVRGSGSYSGSLPGPGPVFTTPVAGQVQQLKQWLDETQRELMNTQSDLTDSEAEVRELVGRLAVAEQQLAAATLRIDALQSQQQQQQQQQQHTQAQLQQPVNLQEGQPDERGAHLERELLAARTAAEASAVEATVLRDCLRAAEAATEAAGGHMALLREQLTAAEGAHSAAADDAAAASRRALDLSQQCEEFEGREGRLQQEAGDLRRQLAEAEGARAVLQGEAADARAQAAKSAAALDAALQQQHHQQQQQQQELHGATSGAEDGAAASAQPSRPADGSSQVELAAAAAESHALRAELDETRRRLAALLQAARASASEAALSVRPQGDSDVAADLGFLQWLAEGLEDRYTSEPRLQALLLRGREVGALLEGALQQLHDLKGGCSCPSDSQYAAELLREDCGPAHQHQPPPSTQPQQAATVGKRAAQGDTVLRVSLPSSPSSKQQRCSTPTAFEKYEAEVQLLERHEQWAQAQQQEAPHALAAANGVGFEVPQLVLWPQLDQDRTSGSGGSAHTAAAKPQSASSAGPGSGLPDYGYGGLDDAWWARPSTTVEPVTDLPDFLRVGPVDVK